MEPNDQSVVAIDRILEIARILAAGILRRRMAPPVEQLSDAKKLPESGQDCLDVSAITRVTVRHGG